MNSASFWFRSIKTRIVISTLVIFLIGIWSLAFYASRMLRMDMERMLSEQQFSTAGILAADVNEEMDHRLRSLEKVATKITPGILADTAAMQTFLDDRPALEVMFSGGLWVTGVDGVTIAGVQASKRRIGVNYSNNDYLIGALKGTLTIGKPSLEQNPNGLFIIMASPIRDTKGNVIGAVMGATNLTTTNFLDNISDNSYGKTGGYLLIDPQLRLIIGATVKNRITEAVPASGTNPAIDRFLDGHEGSALFVSPRGDEVLASVKRVPATGWLVVVRIPTKEVYAPVRNMFNRMMQAAVILTLLLGGLTWWVLKRQLAPMLITVNTLATLSKTEQTPHLLPIARQDEIGELIGSFNCLLENLRHREEIQQVLKDTLQEQYEELQMKGTLLVAQNDQLSATEEMLRVRIHDFETSQKLLKASEERFKALHEASFGGIMVHVNGIILDCNQGLSDMTEYTVEELVGMNSFNLVTSDWHDLMTQNIQNGFDQRYEIEGVRKTGTKYALAIRGKNISYLGRAAQVTEFRDISEIKKAENRIERETNFSNAALDSLPGLFYQIDEQGHFLRWNQNFEKVSGYTAEEIIQLSPSDFFDGEERPHVTESITRAFVTGEIIVEAGFLSKSRIKTPYLFTGKTFVFDQQPCLVGMGIDITERKRAVEERILMEQQFHQAQKLESLGLLAGGIAHDFNNILTVIMGYCYIANSEKVPKKEYKAIFNKIETAGGRATALCQQMLAYAGKNPMTQTRVNLWSLVDEVVKMLQAATKKNVSIVLDLKNNVPDIKGNAGQIQQIIMNLIINAADAIGDANGTIKVELEKYVFEVDQPETDSFGATIRAGTYARLKVADSGSGMDMETQKRIFEPFYTTKFTGRGLGMSAVQGIIKSHEGILHLTSAPGAGTTFTVFFPVPKTFDATEDISSAVESTEELNGTILLVEDEEILRIMGSELLELMGFSVLTAHNGSEAFEMYRDRGSDIDAILLDLIMPVMGGIETYHKLRAANPTVPIIICSGFGVESVADVIMIDHYAGFLHKPYNPSELRFKIMKLLGTSPN